MSGLFKRIWSLARRKGLPEVVPRISSDSGSTLADQLGAVASEYAGIAAPYQRQLIEILDELFVYQPYFQKFLATTLALGNTGHKLEISAPSEQRALAALEVANAFAARCFPWAGGMDGLINGFFCQLARTNALCGEAPPDEGITQLERVYLVPVKTIDFKKDTDGKLILCQRQDAKLVPLNPVQTVWHVCVPWDGSPFPMPAALAAMGSLAKLKKFDESMDGWLEKVGALGVFLGKVERPPQDIGEPNDTYNQRAATTLGRMAQAVHDNLKKGFALFYDNWDFKFQNTAAGAPGAKDLREMVLQGMFAGLQRDPVFFGHNFNTTETFAKVVFEELIGSIQTFQLGVKRAVEHFHRLEFTLQGFGDCGISVKFNPQRSLDAFMHSEADLMMGDGVRADFDVGICDLEEARKKLGYTDAAADSSGFVAAFNRAANRYKLLPFKGRHWPGLDNRQDAGATNNSPSPRPSPARGEGVNQIEYVGTATENGVREARKAARQYVYQVREQLSDAGQTGVDAVYEWARSHNIEDEDLFVQEALQRFTQSAEGSLDAATLEKIAKRHVTTIFRWAKYEDDSLFGPGWERKAGTTFGAADQTAINYMKGVDRFYVSQYVSHDPATSSSISDFLREQYLERGLGRGASPKELGMFRDQFSDLVETIGERRARVIIDTGVSRAQNWGELFALHDEQFTKFTVHGPWDKRTCAWCYAIRGKEFSVATEKSRIDSIIESGDEEISKFGKFITSRFSGQEGPGLLKDATAEAIQASGGAAPPIHPQCRHRLLAVIENAGTGNVYRAYDEPIILVGSYGMAA